MSGLERLKAQLAGELPPPPIAHLIGFELEDVGEGRAALGLEVGVRHTNPMGTLHGGIFCDLGDAAMGYAAAATLDDGESFTTLELKVNFFKPVREGRLRAEGRVVRRTRSVMYVECDITDSGGSLVAKLASTCMVLRGDAAQGR